MIHTIIAVGYSALATTTELGGAVSGLAANGAELTVDGLRWVEGQCNEATKTLDGKAVHHIVSDILQNIKNEG